MSLKVDQVKHIAFMGSKITECTQSAVFSGGGEKMTFDLLVHQQFEESMGYSEQPCFNKTKYYDPGQIHHFGSTNRRRNQLT